MRSSPGVLAFFLLLSGLTVPGGSSLSAQEQVLPWLSGSWVAEAFGGELHERWESGPDGSVVKAEGYFIMDGDTTYSEAAVIGELGGRVYLIAHPSTGGILVWEAVHLEHDVMWFENPNNVNPRRIEYMLGSNDSFTRTLYRNEGGEEIATELVFRKRQP